MKEHGKFRQRIDAINEKREINSTKYRMTNFLLTVLFPVFIVSMAEINQGKYVSKFILFVAEKPTIFLFNILLASGIFYTLLYIFKKSWIASAIEGLSYFTLSIVELFKYGTNGNHLILTDMKLAKSIKSLTSFAYIKITPMLLIYTFIVLAYLFAVFWFNPKINPKPKKRIITVASCLTACVSVIAIPSISMPVYSFFEIDTSESSNTFKLNEKFENNSFLAFFVQTASENFSKRIVEPKDYNSETIDEMLEENSEDNKTKTQNKPNVIVIMSESFADFRRIAKDLETDAYDGFDETVKEGYSGTAIVPTFGSFTVRTEFELNFGLPVKSLNDPNMPQRLLIDREQPTVARYYSDLGYKTAYIHTFLRSFYDRDTIYSNFGFDEMYFEDNLTVPVEYRNSYIDDSVIFNQIEKLLKDNDEPMFIHTTTMQNHQPYNQGKDPDDELGNYLDGVSDMTKDFRKFINYLKTIDEPTVVMMVGDHYPSFKGEDNIYNQLEINGETCSVLYEQPYLIWTNDKKEIDSSVIPNEKISTFYLPYVLMDSIGLKEDSFVQTMLTKMKEVPVYSTHYNSEIPNDEELDILTYDRVLGENISDD